MDDKKQEERKEYKTEETKRKVDKLGNNEKKREMWKIEKLKERKR